MRELCLELRNVLTRLRENGPDREQVDVGLDWTAFLDSAFELVGASSDVPGVLELLLDPLQLTVRRRSVSIRALVGRAAGGTLSAFLVQLHLFLRIPHGARLARKSGRARRSL